jgi:hypothetical protein
LEPMKKLNTPRPKLETSNSNTQSVVILTNGMLEKNSKVPLQPTISIELNQQILSEHCFSEIFTRDLNVRSFYYVG